MATKTIEADVLAVLAGVTVDPLGDNYLLKMTCGQLDPKMYRKVDDVLKRLGGKWSRKAGGHVFDHDPSVFLADVRETGVRPAKNPLAFFATPREVADLMVAAADIRPGMRVLEPSAGDGAILDRIRESCPDVAILALEIDSRRTMALCNKGYTALCVNFLDGDQGKIHPFDRVLMNPPFTAPGDAHAYVAHVNRAWEFLAPGGRIVAICPAGFTFAANNRRLAEFRDWVGAMGTWAALPDVAFEESGTGVNAVMVVLNKPTRPDRNGDVTINL